MWSFQDRKFLITNPRNFVFEINWLQTIRLIGLNTDVISILKCMWLEWVTIRLVPSAKRTGSLELFPTGLVNRRFIYWNQHQVENYSKWLILRTRLVNRTSFISNSYWYCHWIYCKYSGEVGGDSSMLDLNKCIHNLHLHSHVPFPIGIRIWRSNPHDKHVTLVISLLPTKVKDT